MTWIPLLLADSSPCLRYRVLRELLQKPEHDPEVEELRDLRAEDPLVSSLVALQNEDGGWSDSLISNYPAGSRVMSTAYALARLGFLGFDRSYPSVSRGAEYLFSLQQTDGSWLRSEGEAEDDGEVTREGYDWIPLQTALPLRGLAACGYATDPGAEKAYQWLLERRLPDGAWPTGMTAGVYGYVAGYRRLAHSRWGCRSNTTGVMHCLALHPGLRHGDAARQALDLLLGRGTQERRNLGFEVARLVGAEPARGLFTHFARFDAAQMLSLAAQAGASLDDVRMEKLVAFVRGVQGPYGLWEYPEKPQAARWVTFDLLCSLDRLDRSSGDWISLEPPTPFQVYPKRHRRY